VEVPGLVLRKFTVKFSRLGLQHEFHPGGTSCR
jgi:hypothetical protein